MSDPKAPAPPPKGFLQKVAKFVANPTTEWRDLNSRLTESPRESTYDKAELKAMIERKQRNDFVRKREFDMLRRIRREGLSNDGFNSLSLSNIDDSEPPRPSRVDSEVKAKIDAIEKQMVGESFSTRRSPPPAQEPVAPAPVARTPSHAPAPTPAPLPPMDGFGSTTLPGEPAHQDGQGAMAFSNPPDVPMPPSPSGRPAPKLPAAAARPKAPDPIDAEDGGALTFPTIGSPDPASTTPPPARTALAESLAARAGLDNMADPFAVEVNEIAHDPELDEAVIAFANADFEQCEQCLTQLISKKGSRALHAETWLVLFDFYRAIGEHTKFENLAVEYAHQFGWSAPQWFSLPKLVAEAASAAQGDAPRTPSRRPSNTLGWVCPPTIDLEAVKKLRTSTLQLPLPWVLDWTGVKAVEPEACSLLCSLLRVWARDPIEMHWVGGERLLSMLGEASPVSQRDVDPSIWLLKLEVLRLTNRPDQFDVAAIDYCVTYEVSPPSWEACRCNIRLSSDHQSGGTVAHAPSIADASTGFVESQTHEDPSMGQIATVELSGQLVGDISTTLRNLESQTGTANVINVGCARLIRVDFIAAGDLLNWVLTRRGEDRIVQFEDAHRLVALFYGAMGINEHAKVKVRNI